MPRTLIVGDIHGCLAELLELCDRAALGREDHLLSLGDLVDRGPDPAGVVALFRTRPHSAALCGNHERKHLREVLSYSQQVCALQMGADYPEFRSWAATLPYHVETPEFRAVHFGAFPGVPLDAVPEDVRAGTTSGESKLRDRYGTTPWWEHYADDLPIVFGHRVFVDGPLVVRDRVYGLDTGVCHGHALTGLILPERRIVSVPARADHWATVRRVWQVPVLRSLPWPTMTFEQIARKLGTLRGEHPAEALAGISGWVEAVRGALPRLAARLDAELEALKAGTDEVGRAAATHPAASWLLRLQAGRLSRSHLGCATPAQVQALAAALGEDLGVPAGP